VFDDGRFDILTGASGRDWFFSDLVADKAIDMKADEDRT
jgi:hypothetical protein